MAYFVNMKLQKGFGYNGTFYEPGDEIPDFGTGKYDDLLLNRGDVESNGEGNGMEDRIAHQKEIRDHWWTNYDSEVREENEFFKDVKKYSAEKDLVR